MHPYVSPGRALPALSSRVPHSVPCSGPRFAAALACRSAPACVWQRAVLSMHAWRCCCMHACHVPLMWPPLSAACTNAVRLCTLHMGMHPMAVVTAGGVRESVTCAAALWLCA